MPPFQVIQDTPKPDYIGGFFNGASNALALQQQFRQTQKEIMSTHMQNRFNQILLSPGDPKEKYAAIIDLPNQFKNLSLTDIPEGRAFMQRYIDQMMQQNDPYRQAQIKSMNALADYREQGGAYDRKRAQLEQDLADGLITQEQFNQAIQYGAGIAARPRAESAGSPKIVRYFDKDRKMQQAMVPSDPNQYNAAIQRIQAEGGNLDTRVLSQKGNEYEKELSHWTTQFNKTFTKDALGRSVPTPEMEETRDLAKRKIDELTKKIEAELSHTEPSQPFTAQQHGPLAYEPAPGSIVVPDATRQSEAAHTLTPAQPTPQAEPQATGGKELTQEVVQQFSDAAKKKLGKYATVSNIRAYAKQLAKAAGYKVD